MNPTDWKHVRFISPKGLIVGCDFSGIVEKVGKNVTYVSIGDLVGGFAYGCRYSHTGAFAEYVSTIESLVYKKSTHVTHSQNATFGVGCLTAVACLFQRLALSPPSKASSSSTAVPVLIWSGSTSVGQFAIQLAKLSNYTVITTASPKNHTLLKSLGADHIFDYRDPDVVQKIKEVSKNKLAHALDCISESESGPKVVESMGEDGGKVVTLLGPVASSRKDVTIIIEFLYSAYGKGYEIRGNKAPPAPEDRQFISDFIRNELNSLLADNKIKPNVIKQMEGGLNGISEGLEYLRAGKASAEKLVYEI